MKWLYEFGILFSLLLGCYILCLVPISKLPTPLAVANVEGRFLRQDLSIEDKSSYEFNKKWILENQTTALLLSRRARHLGLAVCFVLFVQSVVGLGCESRREKAEASAGADEPKAGRGSA